MAGYLDQYGVADARREGRTKKIVLVGLLIAAIVGGYFLFPNVSRTWSERRTVREFLATLSQKDYQAAYRMWGCTADAPCKFYDMKKFDEDWGPKSQYANPQAAKVEDVDFCDTGVVFNLSFPGADPVALWVERSTNIISFSPWPECNKPHWRFRQFFKKLMSSQSS